MAAALVCSCDRLLRTWGEGWSGRRVRFLALGLGGVAAGAVAASPSRAWAFGGIAGGSEGYARAESARRAAQARVERQDAAGAGAGAPLEGAGERGSKARGRVVAVDAVRRRNMPRPGMEGALGAVGARSEV